MRIYIIPTRYGLLAFALPIIMTIAGVIYNNNSIFLIAFILASLLIAIMIETHRNLKSLEILNIDVANGFAGSPTELRVLLRNRTKSFVQGIQIWPDLNPTNKFNLGSEEKRLCIAHMIIEKRGRHIIKKIRIGTSAPMGLFWTWTRVPTKATYLGYPKPVGTLPLPEASLSLGEGRRFLGTSGEDFSGHKNFHVGESWRHVDWKAVSRGRPWMIKQFQSGEPSLRIFDFSHLRGDVEERLSQLSLWIQKAQTEDMKFTLSMGSLKAKSGSGRQYVLRCLEELAIYGESERTA